MSNKAINIDQDYVVQYREGLGAKIKAKREEAGLNQKQLGDAVGVVYTTIGKIEAGKFPTAIDMYIKIGIALNFKIDFV